MNKSIIFRKIGGIIAEITEQYQYLSDDPENINPLELELFIANSHFLSEHLAILKKMDASAELESSKSKFSTPEPLKPVLTQSSESLKEYQDHSVSGVEEPAIFNQTAEIRGVAVEAKDEMWFEPVSESQALFSGVSETEDITQELSKTDPPVASEVLEEAATELSEPSNIKIEPVAHSETINELRFEVSEKEKQPELLEDVEPDKDVDPIKQPDPVKQSETEREAESLRENFPVNDKTHDEESVSNNSSTVERVLTLNEILSAGKNKVIATPTVNLQEERDLKSMIKLNDKLMFIRDLFNGYSLAYSEAIDLVNRFDNFKSADNFLKQNYAEKNKWSEKQNSVDQFYEILNKRFS